MTEPGDQEALDATAVGATSLLEHLRGCDDCLRQVVLHLYGAERVRGQPIELCPVGTPLLIFIQKANADYEASLPPPPE
jgi:hypothetical protein